MSEDADKSIPPNANRSPSAEADDALMVSVGHGDMEAFGEIVRRHQETVWRTAWRILGDASLAEDAAQDAFLKVLGAAPRYRPEGQFRTYLLRIVTHVCLDFLRKHAPVFTDQPPESASKDTDPAAAVIRDEREQIVRAAIMSLPERQRIALTLRHDDELSYREIAGIMDISEKAVERLLDRARTALAEALQEKP